MLIKGLPTGQYRRKDMAREVALVPQHFDLDFDLAVREVVEMGGYCRGKDPTASGDPELTLARLGVAHLASRRFSELSGGEKQLVVLAQALMQQAPLLLLDEPASALDVSHQLRLFDLLKELNADGLTVLCILHDLNLALHYFDKLLVLSDGEVAAFGPPDDVLRPEVVEAVYGVRAYLHRHAGRTYLTFSPRLRGERRGRVHLICGGGTGAGMMRELADAGYEVTAGVLNALDTDEETGRELGLEMAVEAPFSPGRRRGARREPGAAARRRPRRRERRAGQPRQRAQHRRPPARRWPPASRSGPTRACAPTTSPARSTIWRRPALSSSPARRRCSRPFGARSLPDPAGVRCGTGAARARSRPPDPNDDRAAGGRRRRGDGAGGALRMRPPRLPAPPGASIQYVPRQPDGGLPGRAVRPQASVTASALADSRARATASVLAGKPRETRRQSRSPQGRGG